MTDSPLSFPDDQALGRTFRVDTASVWAEAIDHEVVLEVV